MGIGTYRENTIHRQLKDLYSEGPEYTEVKKDNWICDIVNKEGIIIEIQTGNLSALERKIKALIQNHQIKIIHPIVEKKIIEKTCKSGTISKRTSPKKETPEKIFTELTKLWPYIFHPNLEIILVCCEITEQKRETAGKATRSRFSTENKILNKITGEITLSRIKDYLKIGKIPGDGNFTITDLKKQGNRYGGYTLWVLKKAGIIRETGKDGRKKLYTLNHEKIKHQR